MRSVATPAIILSIKPAGENNSAVRLLSADYGIIYATLYGGPKSKLRPLASVWNSGTLYLYTNEATQRKKITDFDVREYHLSFRTDLYKLYAASLAAEIVIKTNCGGTPDKCFYLFNGFLTGLERADAVQARLGLIRFLWRYLILLGIQPDAETCAACGAPLATGSTSSYGENTVGYPCAYNPPDNGFLCAECMTHVPDSEYMLSETAVRYLRMLNEATPAAARAYRLPEHAEHELKRLLFFLIEQAAGAKLKTITTGIGIL